MKALVIILGIACVALGFGYYNSNAGAGKNAEAAAKSFESVSNQVAELRTKLALEQGTSSQSQSNAQLMVNRRTAEMFFLSNRLVQANLMLKSVQADEHKAQTGLQSKAAALALLEAERDALKQRLDVLPGLQRQLAEAKEKLTVASRERDALAQEIGQWQVEKADLANKLNDLAFLRLQLAKVEQEEDVRLRVMRAGLNPTIPKKARVELQPDGTVRPTITADNQLQK